jgi:hypothetical protein
MGKPTKPASAMQPRAAAKSPSTRGAKAAKGACAAGRTKGDPSQGRSPADRTDASKSAPSDDGAAEAVGKAEPGRGKAAAGPMAVAMVASVDEAGLGWIDAGKGYGLTLDGGKLAARNDKGKRLSSVPKELREGDVADQLEALRDWLVEHERECLATVDQWLLRSLPVPRAVLERVWDDPAWRTPLENAVVVAVEADGRHDQGKAGLFRGVDPRKGIGVVDLDGETGWIDADRIAIPHPILIAELDGWRELVTQLGVSQGVSQLLRETYAKPAGLHAHAIDRFEDGKFAMLMHAVGKARSLGFKVRGGFAVCKAWDGEQVTEARYWIGADSPDAETYTGSLSWVDHREHGMSIAAVGPVAFSEGMRMASAIYAARVVDRQDAS